MHAYLLLMPSLKDAPVISEISSELASETRCSILISLQNKPAKLSSLARELDITVQEAFRNINRLMEASLVKRGSRGYILDSSNSDNSGVFHLTELGRLVTKQIIPYILVVRMYQEVLEDHTLRDIPDKFVQRIGAFQNCKVVKNVTAIFEKLKKLESAANKSLKIMVSQAWPEEGKILVERAINGVEVSGMFGRNTVFPKEVIDTVIPTIEGLARSGKIKRKMLDRVNIALYISESQSALMLPNMKDEVDMNILIVGDDPFFNEWCLDLFNYFWERAGPANLDDVRIV
jgi:predicted transcriptional regulator